MREDGVFRKMRDAGLELHDRGMVATKSGNISVRVDDCILITTHGSKLGKLGRSDIVELDLDDSKAKRASMDAKIHLEIHRNTSWKAVVHAHPVFASLLSLEANEIRPLDVEGRFYFPKVPVIPWDKKAAVRMGRALKGKRVAVARAHGTYAAAETLDDAVFWTTSLEHSCNIIYLDGLRKTRRQGKDEQERG
jgi:L-fuculose-phosphate aldolase